MSARLLQNLREQRAAFATEIHNLLDPAVTDYTADVQAQVDAKLGEVDKIDARLASVRRALDLGDDAAVHGKALADRAGVSADAGEAAFRAARKAFVNALRDPRQLSDADRSLVVAGSSAEIRKALGNAVSNIAIGAPETGGVLVPSIVMPVLLEKLKAFGGVRLVASQISTAGGNPLTWGTNDDTAAEGEMVAEGSTAADDDLTFGSVSIGAYKFSSKTIPISLEMLQDSAVDIESVVLNALAMRIARGQNRKFTTGTGSSQPKGVVTAAALGYTMATGNTASITWDALTELLHSLDPSYRGNASFMMHDATFKAVKGLKDQNGRPLWLPSVGSVNQGDASFDTLLGKRLVINQHMATMAAGAKPVLCGDFSKYLIRDVMDVLILRFTDSAYAKKAQVGFLAWARADGQMIDASNESIRYLANSAS